MKKITTCVQKIVEHLRHEITYGKLKNGKHIKESEVAKFFNLSRVPVREAFRILQSEGYITVIPNRGSFVKKISPDYINETAAVYAKLAPIVLEKAIPNYTKLTYKKADSILNQIEQCSDFCVVGYLIWDFARVIYSPAKMEYILSIFDDIYKQSIRVLNEFFQNEKNAKFKIQTHRHFLELCKAQKKEEAIKLWSELINQMQFLLLKNTKS